MILKNAKMVLEDRVLAGWVKIEAGRIVSINAGDCTDAGAIDLNGNYLMPGFIDPHVHGGYGTDFSDGTIEAYSKFAEKVVEEGVTKYCWTALSYPKATLDELLKVVSKYLTEANMGAKAKMLGIHLEGPFLSPQYKGAQILTALASPSIEWVQDWLKYSNYTILMMTYAPEKVDNPEFINFMMNQNIILSIGHSNADFKMVKKAVTTGANRVTHLYNAMSPFHHRHPGVVPAALYYDELMCELISDGVHVDPDIIATTYKIKTAKRICLATDGIRARGLGDGIYSHGGLEVAVKNNTAYINGTNTLAGTVVSFDYCVRLFKRATNCSMVELAQVSSSNTARNLKIYNETGSISPNKLADLVVLDADKLTVLMTIVEGKIAFDQRF